MVRQGASFEPPENGGLNSSCSALRAAGPTRIDAGPPERPDHLAPDTKRSRWPRDGEAGRGRLRVGSMSLDRSTGSLREADEDSRSGEAPNRRLADRWRAQTETRKPPGVTGLNGGLRGGGRRDLLSHSVAAAVPSARRSLTSEFGMGSGMASALSSPAGPFVGDSHKRARKGMDGSTLCRFDDDDDESRTGN